MCLVATILVFCENQNVHLKFLNQNACQFRLHMRGAIVIQWGLRVCMAHGWGQDTNLGAAIPP